MTDESASSPAPAENSQPDSTPRGRRVSSPRPKKAAKTSPEAHSPKPANFPEFPSTTETPDAQDANPPSLDWPEPEPPTSGNSTPKEGPKRKRRRKKGKGGHAQNPAPQADSTPDSEDASQPPRPQSHRVKHDPELLAKFAWKIYLSEVSEEGVALVSDADAKELSRRCFRLAEIFLDEQARHR